jgi:hypothetical protein
MNETTIKVIHWIWGEPELANLLREAAKGDEFEWGDDEVMALIASFVFPEDRSRGIRAWIDIHGQEDRVQALYESLTRGRKTPAGRLEWLGELDRDAVCKALLPLERNSGIYVHATLKGYAPGNRYRVHNQFGVYEAGSYNTAAFWILAEPDRQICPMPIGERCTCTVVQHG